ncbi:MAG: TetR/AcrR family transcriptional regulator [Pseudomonadota bacterium]
MAVEPDEESYAARRRAAIEAAAYAVLAEKGYKAASMLEIARRAGASNETLYKWYGNKQRLFRALVTANAKRVTDKLSSVGPIKADADPADLLEPIGVALLDMLTSDRAIALNRAAAGDVHDTGTLGEALAKAGRETVLPQITTIIVQALDRGTLTGASPVEIATNWLALLVGDLQVRLVTGQAEAPDKAAQKERARSALVAIRTLYTDHGHS